MSIALHERALWAFERRPPASILAVLPLPTRQTCVVSTAVPNLLSIASVGRAPWDSASLPSARFSRVGPGAGEPPPPGSCRRLSLSEQPVPARNAFEKGIEPGTAGNPGGPRHRAARLRTGTTGSRTCFCRARRPAPPSGTGHAGRRGIRNTAC